MNNSRRSFLRLSSTLVISSLISPFFSRTALRASVQFTERASYTMGSIVTVKAYSNDTLLCNIAIDTAFREMKEIDRLMSVFDETSQVSLLNRRSTLDSFTVDQRIVDVLTAAQRYHHLTDGAFDLTIEPLMNLYGFRDEISIRHFPSDKEIGRILDSIGMKHVRLDTATATVSFTHPSTRLDFGGIAVGYAIDRAVTVLRAHGIESALINHSGDLYAIGTPPEANAWDVGITDPMRSGEIITTVSIKDQALSTSGNYQNVTQAGGKTIGHILNPSNGRTATSILSGTVIAQTALEADALSTGRPATRCTSNPTHWFTTAKSQRCRYQRVE